MSRLHRTCTISRCDQPVWAREMCRKHYARWHQHGDPETLLVQMSPAGAALKFLDSMEMDGEGCLRWPFSINNHGYAQINIKGRKHLVTRIVCERRNGPPPSTAHQAAHSCGKGHEACVAPWHLSWKTPAENIADAKAHGTFSRGEKHALKLTAGAVDEIRRLGCSLPQAVIAKRYGISQTMVSKILRDVAWRAA